MNYQFPPEPPLDPPEDDETYCTACNPNWLSEDELQGITDAGQDGYCDDCLLDMHIDTQIEEDLERRAGLL